MNIIIHPFSSCLPSGKTNAKNFPHWERLIDLLQQDGHDIMQIGVTGEKQLVKDFRPDLNQEQHKEMIQFADTFICVDSWYQHFAQCFRPELKGIVLWSQSNPQIFGYKNNYNLFMDKKYFRPLQFDIWHKVEFDSKAFVSADFVLAKVRTLQQSNMKDFIYPKQFAEPINSTLNLLNHI